MPLRRVIAVDADGVCYNHRKRISQHLRDRWNIIMSPDELKSGQWNRMTGIEEVDRDLCEVQLRNPEMFLKMEPMPGALRALLDLRMYGRLILVCNRMTHMREVTYLVCARDFGVDDSPTGSVFDEIHCYPHTKKWKAAKAKGATWALDDNPNIALEYAQHGVCCFLIGGKPTNRPSRFLKVARDIRDVVNYFERSFGKVPVEQCR